jgi:hypothetical protein
MLNYLSLAAFALAAVLAPSGLARAAEDHGEHFVKCAKVCAACQVECDSCFAHCLELAAGGKKEHQKTAQLCTDCAECCKSCATLCARKSPLAAPMLECCVKCCEKCAAACEKFPDDKHMAQCAKSCRDCAKECTDLLNHVGK